MISVQHFFLGASSLTTNTTATMDTNSNSVVNGEEEAERIRALQTVLALSALLGGPAPSSSIKDNRIRISKDSVAAWATESLTIKSNKEPLAESVDCPPFTDPSSVLITDQVTLEFELEPTNDDEPLVVGQVSSPTRKSTSSGACSLAQSSTSCNSSYSSTSTRVRFQETVDLVSIPSHRDMDSNTIDSIWTSIDDVQENLQRNSMEYHADGRDWQQATEEEDMILDGATGEYVHPATWEDLQIERHQAAQAEAQRQHRIRFLAEQQRAAAKAATSKKQSMVTSTSSPKMRRRRPKGTLQRSTPPCPKVKGSRNGRLIALQQPTIAGASLTRFADT